jgi:hypothetical protein
MDEPKNVDEQKKPASKSTGAWKVWLGIILFIAYIIGVQIEHNSPSAQAHRDRAYGNAQNSVANEAYDSCSGTASESECREQARQAAQMAREKLAPMLGK